MVVDLVGEQRLEIVRARPQRRAGQRQPLAHDRGHVDFGLEPAEHGDGYMPPVIGQTFDIARDVIARNHVEHHVDALAAGEGLYLLDEVLRLVIDRQIRPQIADRLTFLFASRSRDHGNVEGPRQLDRHGPDSAGAAMDQQRVAIPGPAALEHIVPYGEQRFGDCRGDFHRHRLGHAQAMRRMCQAVFRIAPARHERADTPAQHFGRRALADRHDGARYFEARDRRGTGRRRVVALPLDHVGPVDPGVSDTDQHLVLARLGHGQLLGPQYLGSAGLVETRR